MKVMALNGSPRKKNWNTVTLLEKVLEGAASAGAETELNQLYGLKYSGCISCFSCKKKGRGQDGVCAVQDDLTSVLDQVKEVDALIIGTPVYYGCETAATRALLERLCFPYLTYSPKKMSFFPKSIKMGLVYTMNVNDELVEEMGYKQLFDRTKSMLEMHFNGPCELLLSTDTLQYGDYEKYESEMFNKDEKLKRHREDFPEDCKRAFDLGVRLVS